MSKVRLEKSVRTLNVLKSASSGLTKNLHPEVPGRHPSRAAPLARGWVTAARDGRLRKPAPGGGCASCLSRTFHRFRCTRCLFRMCGFGVCLRQHGYSRPISRGALRSLDSCPVQANGREPAPGRVPRGVVRRDKTAARRQTLPAFSSAVAAPSLLEDVSFV